MPSRKRAARGRLGPNTGIKRRKTTNSGHGQLASQAMSRPSGNRLFQKLPIEVRLMIWKYCLSCKDQIAPLQKRQGGNTFAVEQHEYPASKKATRILTAIYKTCRLFALDQIRYNTFYSVNKFVFAEPETMAIYLAVITPSKATAIKKLFLTKHLYTADNSLSKKTLNLCRDAVLICGNLQRLQLELIKEHSFGIDWQSIDENDEFIPFVPARGPEDSGLADSLRNLVGLMPVLRVLDVTGYIMCRGQYPICGYKHRVEVSQHGFRFYDEVADDEWSERSEYAVPLQGEDFFDGREHSMKRYIECIVMNRFSELQQAMSGVLRSNRIRPTLSKGQWQHSLLAYHPSLQLDISGPHRSTLVHRKFGHNIPYLTRHFMQQNPNRFGQFSPTVIVEPPQQGEKTNLWYPFTDIRATENNEAQIALFGEGMNPPFTITERQRVAREFKNSPKVWTDLGCIFHNHLPDYVRAAYVEGILRWYRKRLDCELRKPSRERNLPLNPRWVLFSPLYALQFVRMPKLFSRFFVRFNTVQGQHDIARNERWAG